MNTIRFDHDEFRIINLRQLLDEAAVRPRARGRWAASAAEAGLHVEVECDASLQVWGYPAELKELLNDLIGAAVEAMPPDGHLTVRASLA